MNQELMHIAMMKCYMYVREQRLRTTNYMLHAHNRIRTSELEFHLLF